MLDKYEESLELVKKVFKYDPNHVNAQRCKGGYVYVIFKGKAQITQSDLVYLIQQGQYQYALTWINKALQFESQESNTIYTKAHCLILKQFKSIIYLLAKQNEAILETEIVSEALNKEPNHLIILTCKSIPIYCYSQHKAQIEYFNFTKIFILDRFKEAIVQADQGLEIDPKNINILDCKAQCLNQTSKLQRSYYCSRSNFDSQIKISQCFTLQKLLIFINQKLLVQIYSVLLTIYALNEYRNSISYADQLLIINPNDESTIITKGQYTFTFQEIVYNYINILLILIQLREFKEALVWQDKALSINPKNLSMLVSQCSNYLISLIQHIGQYSEALKLSEQVLDGYPQNLESLKCKFKRMVSIISIVYYKKLFQRTLYMLTRYQEAINSAKVILDHEPKNINILQIFGINKLYPQQCKVYDSFRFLDILLCKAHSLRLLGEFNEALDIVDKVLCIDLNNLECSVKLKLYHSTLFLFIYIYVGQECSFHYLDREGLGY